MLDQKTQDHPYIVGKSYFIRTVTMHLIGKLSGVYENEIVIEEASWVADSGRFSEALKKGKLNEVEPFPDGSVIIGRGSIIDASIWQHDLPRVAI